MKYKENKERYYEKNENQDEAGMEHRADSGDAHKYVQYARSDSEGGCACSPVVQPCVRRKLWRIAGYMTA